MPETWGATDQPIEVGDILRQGPSRQPMKPGDKVTLKSPAGQKVTLTCLSDGSMRVTGVSSGSCFGMLLVTGAGLLALAGIAVKAAA